MKKLMVLMLCALLALTLIACGNTSEETVIGEDPASWGSDLEEDGKVEIPSPFEDCETMEDAARICGFDMTVPASFAGYSDRLIQAVENELLQVIDSNGEDNILFRKEAGTEDASGDYTPYAENNTVSVGEYEVTMKGDDGMVSVAVWAKAGYSYAVVVRGPGISSDDMAALISEIK